MARFTGDRFHQFRCPGFTRGTLRPKYHKRQFRAIGNIVAASRKVAAIERCRARFENLLSLIFDADLDGLWRDATPACNEHLVQIRAKAESIPIAVPGEVVTNADE